MSELAITQPQARGARVAVALGALALLLFVGGGFTVGGIFWILGAAAGTAAIIAGVAANRQGTNRSAIIAIILGAIPAAWFVAYIVVDAFN